MPDTKIKKTPNGWIDVDNPTVTYPIRRAARDARRRNKLNGNVVRPRPVQVVGRQPVAVVPSAFYPFNAHPVGNYTVVKYKDTVTGQEVVTQLTPLQNRLFKRLTERQGVSEQNAVQVLSDFRYSASASYGHMREAGANHHEALQVISLLNAEVSMTYGIARAKGLDHTAALRKALYDNNTTTN